MSEIDNPKCLFKTTTERVKNIDFHPEEPWVLASLYSGMVCIYNFKTKAKVKDFQVCDIPVRAAKFIARKNWIITGSDDSQIRIINYNTGEKVKSFEAHPDYIRCLAVHPTEPLVLSGSDDMTIRLWNWEKGWKCEQVYEGHSHFVMHIAFNPKDHNVFASASLDGTIRMWSLKDKELNKLEGHEKGVNYVDFDHRMDKPQGISSSDDNTVRVWDLQSKSCIQILDRHTQNVNFAFFHPRLSIALSGSEDGTVRIWDSETYRLRATLNHNLERAWCAAYSPHNNRIALGYDEGIVVIQLESDAPVITMGHTGKVILAKKHDIYPCDIDDEQLKDGKFVKTVKKKLLGTCDFTPKSLKLSPNGKYVAACGDKEYGIHTALSWIKKNFGYGRDVVWAQDSKSYAVHESDQCIRIFLKEKLEFKEKLQLKKYEVKKIFGGTLLGVCTASYIEFYDWEQYNCVRRIDLEDVNNVFWSDSGELVTLANEEAFFVLNYHQEEYESYLQSDMELPDEGVEEAFDFHHEGDEEIASGKWVDDCFTYTTSKNQVKRFAGGRTETIAHCKKDVFLLGYLPKGNRIFVTDMDQNISSYTLHLSVVKFETAVLEEDLEAAREILETVSEDQKGKLAEFLEEKADSEKDPVYAQSLTEFAFEVATDLEQKFRLAVQLNKFDDAIVIADELKQGALWEALGDKALEAWKFSFAEKCYQRTNDLNSLFLFYVSSGNYNGIREVADKAVAKGENSIAFNALFQIGAIDEAIDVLVKAGQVPEAAMLARTYAPDQVSRIVKLWKANLESLGQNRIANSLADPATHANMFPELSKAGESIL